MERRKLAVIFLGVSMILMGVYAFANRSGNASQVGGVTKDNLFSADGSATAGQGSDVNEGWDALYSGDAMKESPEDKNNATKNIAKAAFEQMKALDQQGKSPFDVANINTPEMQAAIESSLSGSVDAFFGDISISNSDIKIATVSTKAVKISYLKGIESILARHPVADEYKNVPNGLQGLVETSCTNGDTGIAKGIADLYDATAKDFINARVPSVWTSFHKQVIEHYMQGSVLFTAIAKCGEDPLKGFAAAQELSSFGMRSSTLQNLLKKMYTEVGL